MAIVTVADLVAELLKQDQTAPVKVAVSWKADTAYSAPGEMSQINPAHALMLRSKPIAEMTAADLLARAEMTIDSEDDLAAFLLRAATLADETDPALALLLTVLADETSEIAALRAPVLEALAERLHPDTDGLTLARAAARALAQFVDEDDPGVESPTEMCADCGAEMIPYQPGDRCAACRAKMY